ncbi:DUF1289 domain-containing protein [Vibrio sp. RE86]|uniref:DUF1289 domain-containing protein n=1 Tax=Vibrio sp. RE86 TaxID=2607605 RepID=UPI001493C98A|nr:DUF1289 domain-containing protein [Vibrio sp. RE86]NOH80542.1 DUF1289 domain-containing protein [Vibrio sp. RE86]
MSRSSQEPPANPCIRHCCLDCDDICLGCFRTLEEILNWSQSSLKEKQRIIQRCNERKRMKRHR